MCENDFDFRTHDFNNKLKTFKIPTDLSLRKRKKKTNDDDINNNNNSPITLTRELENIDKDILTIIVVHTEKQLGSVIKEKNLIYSVITTKVMFEMKKDEQIKQLLEDNPHEFWALFQF